MFSFFAKSPPPLDETATHWLFDTFAWSIAQLGGGYFRDHTALVLPTNAFFPGRADSVHGMADLIFERCAFHAGMAHWPLQLLAPGACPLPTAGPPRLSVSGGLRGAGSAVRLSNDTARLPLGYDPSLVGNPEALIASFAQGLAGLLTGGAAAPPPGGIENLPHATEVAAVFLGFGLMLANSAKTIQVRSCGSCGGGQAGRQSFLSQEDITYALALFCALKEVPAKAVLPHLAKHLRPFYKRAAKDIEARKYDLEALRAQVVADS